jgi:hypothetical protein
MVGTGSTMKGKGLPGYFLRESIATTIYFLNRSPTRSMEGMIPYEAGNGRKSNMGHLSAFRCIVYTMITKPHLKKLDDLSTKMVFVGYEMGSMAY